MQISVRPIKKTNRVVFSSTSSDNDTLHPPGDGGDMGSDEEGAPMKTVPPPEVETLVAGAGGREARQFGPFS